MNSPIASLPDPSDEERAHAARVASHLRELIDAAGGRIGFDRFMETVLYAPGLGYYVSGKRQFGEGGDFVTAPELGSLFGECVAGQIAEVLVETGGDIIEFGAGSGALCLQVLGALEKLGCAPDNYYILETSAQLAAEQRRTIGATSLAERVHWIERLPTAFTGVVVANEVLDAMPAARFQVAGRGARWLEVGVDGDRFAWRPGAEVADCPLAGWLQALDLPSGYVSEFNPRATAWVAGLGDWLRRGVVILADYGYPRREYYHPQRIAGTLRCFFRHHAHDDPLVLTGVQDVTAHVDFTAVAEAADFAGIELMGYTSLTGFLFGAGLTERLRGVPEDPRLALRLANEVKRLTLPQEMGEVFKVIALGRGVDRAPTAFRDADRSGLLRSGQ